ncbi:hypothetical protein BGW36DRAFT_401961 [Talaromyces proteolyticus]|uniref:Urease accessory protein UreF n=1 Tax=Talaromyces proteolyticus TaxID=1131652 RepID=A0AAD4KF56_9EURO|nr:uncharacterized protein BGW36DRAFT_401961 [Talaromyces proteolyticus]KAH8689637.1 hypothetical protein BGW36DRAFT_401961 [Talaromyces proteolyticus]
MSRVELEKEIVELELRLENTRNRLQNGAKLPGKNPSADSSITSTFNRKSQLPSFVHSLLLICDSALPLGSFAYSSGLESFIAHNKALPVQNAHAASFKRFLKLSITSVSSTSLPYLFEAYRSPAELERLDNDLDASTPCTVARRASVAQGRALLGVWERSFRGTYLQRSHAVDSSPASAVAAIEGFAEALKFGENDDESLGLSGHFAPLWGVLCSAMGIEINLAAYTFMLNHAKAVMSAAVRASVMGPYQAQSILASEDLCDLINERIAYEYDTKTEDAGQVAPVLDLWVGRHELLYSRIFNS